MMRKMVVAFSCALALACQAAPARAGLLPDIRGVNFGAADESFQGVSVLGGQVTIPGLGTTPFEDNPTRDVGTFNRFPGSSPVPTFLVIADPGAPNDPTRIEIQTRLPYGEPNTPPGEIVSLNLIGSYDRNSGAISVTGSRSGPTGSILDDRGVLINPFGNGQDFEVIIGFTSLTYSLHGTLTQGPNGLTITGTDPFIPPGGPGNLVISGTTFVYFNPVGDFNIADARLTGTVASGQAYGGLYNWTASTVPEPSSIAMLGVGLVGLGGVGLRRRPHRA